MIDTNAPTTGPMPAHSVKCVKGRHEQLISSIDPSQGYTTWCRSCRIVETITWDRLPESVLRDIVDGIGRVLAGREASAAG